MRLVVPSLMSVAAVVAAVMLMPVPATAGPLPPAIPATPNVTDPGMDAAIAAPAYNSNCLPVAPPALLAQCQFSNADVVAAWVTETSDEVQLAMHLGGSGAPSTLFSSYDWNVHFKVADKDYTASGHLDGCTFEAGCVAAPFDGAVSFSGAASSGDVFADAANGGIVVFHVKKADIGDPKPGSTLTGLYVDTVGYAMSNDQKATATDRAPDSGFGTDYTFGGAAAASSQAAPANATKASTSTASSSGSGTHSSGPAPTSANATATTSAAPPGPQGNATRSMDTTTPGPAAAAAKSSPAGWLALPGTLAAVALARRRMAA